MISLDQINDLLATVVGGPSEKIDLPLVQILSRIADEFVEDMARGASQLANLRGSSSVAVSDVRSYLEGEYRIKLSGYGSDAEEKARKLKQEAKSRTGAESHRQRIAAVRRVQHMSGHHNK
jgi:transcription initiation factor TFIID subunit TAF12